MPTKPDASTQQPVTINELELLAVEIGRNESAEPVRSLLIRMTTDSGTEGWGEAELRWRAEELGPREDLLLSALAGRSVFDTEELQTSELLEAAPLRSAVEMACWDLLGRTVGRALCQLQGGNYRRRVPLAVRLSGGNTQRTVQLARELVDQGFHTHLLSSTGRPEQDVMTLRAIREGGGDRLELRLDAAGAYDAETARDLCEELDGLGIELVIDPLATEELYPVASLRRQTNVPLAVWRAIHGAGDVLAAVRSGAAGCVVIDLQRIGGILPARRCAAVAQAGGIMALLAGATSVGVATAAMLQLAAATPALACLSEAVYHQLRDDVLVERLETTDGMLVVPQGPGLGVEVDRRKIERYQVG